MSTEILAETTTREAAEQRLSAIRVALEVADETLAAAYAAEDWKHFDLPDFAAYCDELLPQLKFVKLRKPARLARHRKLMDLGASEREAGASTGCSVGTAHNDRLELTGRAPLKNEQEPALKLTQDVIDDLTNWQVVLRAVRRAQDAGLTSLEFEREKGWGHGRASAAFHSAERKGYVTRLVGQYRDGYGVYVTVHP